MRIFFGVFLAVISFSMPSKQVATETKCKIQDLAIEAALGDPVAQHNLGVAFHRGDEIPQDFSKAATMWKLASTGGVVEAYNNLGYLTYNGKGVRQNYAEGMRLWRVAAEKGFVESQVHLASAYASGKVNKPDFIESYAWAKTARYNAEKSSDAEMLRRAISLLVKAMDELSAIEKNTAEKKAQSYISQFVPR